MLAGFDGFDLKIRQVLSNTYRLRIVILDATIFVHDLIKWNHSEES